MINVPIVYIGLAALGLLLILAVTMIWRLVKAVSIRASEKGIISGPIHLKRSEISRTFGLLKKVFDLIRRL